VTGGNEQFAEKPSWWTRPGEQFTKTRQSLGAGGGQEIWDRPWFGVNREPDAMLEGGEYEPTYSEPDLESWDHPRMEEFGLDRTLQVSYEECFTVDYEGKLERVESEACGYTKHKVNSTYGVYEQPQFS